MSEKITRMLQAAEAGDDDASERLLLAVYEELKILAVQRLAREPADHTLQPTGLVHEAYLRLVGNTPADWNSRGHFFGAAAEAMRRILIDRARRVARPKHGGDRRRMPLDEDLAAVPPPDELLALDEALQRLEQEAPTVRPWSNYAISAG